MFRNVKYFIIILIILLLTGITSAQGDLDNDGIPDNIDPDTVINASTTLNAGEYTFLNLIITNDARLTLESNSSFSGFKGVIINANNLRIDPSSTLFADDMGYGPGQGPGSPWPSNPGNRGGAGYGGHGGASIYGEP
ncbi:MAG: hypothetical protein LUQ04_10595, partial [Methanoregula sp.]|nr:hypothetical protein [Methanoregula sp.]